jgi:hypothetical protein
MNRTEAIKLLALIKVAYPTAYRDADKETQLATVAMWQRTFPDVPYVIMEMAFDHFRRVSKFPPTVAEMYAELDFLYGTAIVDSMNADNKQMKEAAEFVIDHTWRYRGEIKSEYRPNYKAVSNLLDGKSRDLLQEGDE